MSDETPEKIDALIVFGPEFKRTVTAIRKMAPAISLMAGKRIGDISMPKATLSPCTLSFSHWVPDRRGAGSDQSHFSAWQDKLFDHVLNGGITTEDFGLLEKVWHCDATTSYVVLSLSWETIDSLQCVRLATAIETGFYEYAKPWWKFW